MKHDALQAGQRLVFEIRVGSLSGVNSVDFADVHVQYQLDSFKDHSAPHDDDNDDDDDDEDHVYTTSCKNDFDGSSGVDFGYSKAFSMVVTDHMLEAIQHGDLSFEVYGLPTTTLLKSLHDEQHRLTTNHHQQQHQQQQQQQQSSVEKEHNVYAWVEICELAQISGEYTPVQVNKPARTRSRVDADADEAIMTTPSSPIQPSYSMAQYSQGTFILRQGQQRRIVLTLRHDWILPTVATNGVDGDGLPLLDGMDGLVLWIGDIRCRSDADDGAPPASSQDVSIPLTVMNKTTDTLVLQGAWDSSLHNSLLLNRLTEAGHTVDLTIKWVFHGAPFQMDLGVQITAGTLPNGLVKRQSLLRNIFSSSSTKSRNANKKRTSRDSGYSAGSNDTNDDDDDDDDDEDDDEAKDDISDPATSRTTTRQDKKTCVTGIYRVWERPRRLSSYFIHDHTEHHEWQQRQMDQIKTYDQARRSMSTKMEVANTRYTLALWDLLQNRHMSRGRRFSVLMENNTNDSLNDTDDDQQQKIPQQRLVDREDRMLTIIQQWMESKHQENTGLQLIHGLGSTVSPGVMETPLYAIHQIALRL
jgi:kinesin family protein 1